MGQAKQRGTFEERRQQSIDRREIELRNQFVRMTSEEIREMMNTTDNTTTRLICWEYLQTL